MDNTDNSRYYLNEGSEINCVVFLEEDGLLDVTPINPEDEYGFTYKEVDVNGNVKHQVWFSEDEINNEPVDWAIFRIEDLSNRFTHTYNKLDSNHSSKI